MGFKNAQKFDYFVCGWPLRFFVLLIACIFCAIFLLFLYVRMDHGGRRFVGLWQLDISIVKEFFGSITYFPSTVQCCTKYSALALVISKIEVGTTVKHIWSRPQFFNKTWSYISGELRECSNFKNLFVKRGLSFPSLWGRISVAAPKL